MILSSRLPIREMREFPSDGFYFLQRVPWQYDQQNMCIGGVRKN